MIIFVFPFLFYLALSKFHRSLLLSAYTLLLFSYSVHNIKADLPKGTAVADEVFSSADDWAISPLPPPEGGPARVEGAVSITGNGPGSAPVNPLQKYDFRERRAELTETASLIIRLSNAIAGKIRFQNTDIVYPYHWFT